MAVFRPAGFAERDPGYYVIDVPVYNFIIELFPSSSPILIWKRSPYALPAAVITFSVHVLIMLILQLGYSDVVARDSIVAMTIRITTWLIILALLIYAARQRKAASI
jgi:hypothetical protein